MKKVVFFDIDGTLVSDRNQLPESTVNAVISLKKEGILPVIATGRSPLLLDEIAKKLQINSYISMNGQYIVINGEQIYHNPIPASLISDFTEFAAANNDGIMLCGNSKVFSNSVFSISEESSRIKAMKKAAKIIPRRIQMAVVRRSMKTPPKPESYASEKIYQVILDAPTGKENIYSREFKNLKFTRFNRYMLDAINKGVSKATGIEKILDYFGVSRENSYAFGDHMNDLEMLKYAGVGVAMGNAVQEVKDVSDLITDHVKKDGIGKALRKLELIR